jgi:uncharacterized protein YPO0396
MQKMDKSIIEFNKSDSQLPIVSNLSGKHEAFITKIHDSKGTDYARRYPSDIADEMESLLHSLDDKFELLDGHILNKKMASLNEMGEQFKKTFICDLCFHVYGHIREGAQYLSMLNSKLKGFFFGGDSFQFSYKTHPEMKMYNKFFEIMSSLVSDIKEIDDLEQHLEDLSPDALDTYLELRNSLLDDDEVRAQRTLLKIMDYREYFLVDILKYRKTDSGLSAPISLDEDATGSGGQLETSAYVIRSAGLVGALGCDKEQSSLKLMMIDEAFNKSDNTRVRAIIQYLSETLGFQLLIAMPTRSTSSLLSEFDKLFLVTKQNNSSSPVGTNTYVNEKYLNKEAIKDLWEKSKIKIENNTIASFMDKVS